MAKAISPDVGTGVGIELADKGFVDARLAGARLAVGLFAGLVGVRLVGAGLVAGEFVIEGLV